MDTAIQALGPKLTSLQTAAQMHRLVQSRQEQCTQIIKPGSLLCADASESFSNSDQG